MTAPLAPFDGLLLDVSMPRDRRKLCMMFLKRQRLGLLPRDAQLLVYGSYVLVGITHKQLRQLVAACEFGVSWGTGGQREQTKSLD